jgi:Domain of unknown function (DUF6458)
MPTGTSIFLIAVGAILRYAVTASVSGISLATVGLILMIVGVVGLLVSLLYMFMWSPRRGAVARDRIVERGPYEEPPVRP